MFNNYLIVGSMPFKQWVLTLLIAKIEVPEVTQWNSCTLQNYINKNGNNLKGDILLSIWEMFIEQILMYYESGITVGAEKTMVSWTKSVFSRNLLSIWDYTQNCAVTLVRYIVASQRCVLGWFIGYSRNIHGHKTRIAGTDSSFKF